MNQIDLQDDPGQCDYGNAQLVVTDYEEREYDGSGTALVLCDDGRVEEINMGHCSCYGPWDEAAVGTWPSVEAFRQAQDDVVQAVDAKLAAAFLAAVEIAAAV